MNTTEIGQIGEKLAEIYLKKNGYKILERNIHQSHNEIDIIASDSDFIVFVEVKTRSVGSLNDPLSYGTPAQAVTKGKQMRTVVAANDYLASRKGQKYQNLQPRIDVVEVYLDKITHKAIKINHIYDAFGA